MASLIDIIVPVYKNTEMTMNCIQSIYRHLSEISAYSPRFIVIHDSPGHEVGDFLSQAHSDGIIDVLIENEVNLGFVKSVNKGFDEARRRGASVLLINSDTVTFSGTMCEMLSVAQADPMIGFVNPRSNNASIASFPLPVRNRFTADVDLQACYKAWHVLSAYLPRMTFTPTAVGFYMFIRATIIQNFGGFDEAFGPGYEEENDFVMRANKVGFRSVFANHAYAYHAGSASFLLTEIDIAAHRDKNFAIMSARHPEFLSLLRRYDDSAHYQAERLLRNLLLDADGKLGLAVNMLTMGAHFNGTSEVIVNFLKSIGKIRECPFKVTVIIKDDLKDFFGLGSLDGLEFTDVITDDYAIAIFPGQPFHLDHLDMLSALAPINVYIMHDTIAMDCGYLSHNQDLDIMWGAAMRNAHGIYYISDFARQTFENRFEHYEDTAYFTQLHPTALSAYKADEPIGDSAGHIYVSGNHFAHKAAASSALLIAEAFPSTRVVVADASEGPHERIDVFKSGEISGQAMAAVLGTASVVVLPSYYEGFGFTLMHALAHNRPVVARDIPATKEILATFKGVRGVFLFSNNDEMIAAVGEALRMGESQCMESNGNNWLVWSENFSNFLEGIVAKKGIYRKLIGRINEISAIRGYLSGNSTIYFDEAFAGFRSRKEISYSELKNLSSEDFIKTIYNFILKRNPDSSGFRSYQSDLQAGVTRMQVISTFLASEEYARIGSLVKIKGLKLAKWLHDCL